MQRKKLVHWLVKQYRLATHYGTKEVIRLTRADPLGNDRKFIEPGPACGHGVGRKTLFTANPELVTCNACRKTMPTVGSIGYTGSYRASRPIGPNQRAKNVKERPVWCAYVNGQWHAVDHYNKPPTDKFRRLCEVLANLKYPWDKGVHCPADIIHLTHGMKISFRIPHCKDCRYFVTRKKTCKDEKTPEKKVKMNRTRPARNQEQDPE